MGSCDGEYSYPRGYRPEIDTAYPEEPVQLSDRSIVCGYMPLEILCISSDELREVAYVKTDENCHCGARERCVWLTTEDRVSRWSRYRAHGTQRQAHANVREQLPEQ